MKRIFEFLLAVYFVPLKKDKSNGFRASKIFLALTLTHNLFSIICCMAPLLKGILTISNTIELVIFIVLAISTLYYALSKYIWNNYKDDDYTYIEKYSQKLPVAIWISICVVHFFSTPIITILCMKFLLALRL